MSTLALEPYVGKKVIVQFRTPDAWLTCHQDKGDPAILAMQPDPRKPPQFIPSPFLMGEVVRRESHGIILHAVRILDENKKPLEIWVNPEAILTVTEAIAVEPPLRIVQ